MKKHTKYWPIVLLAILLFNGCEQEEPERMPPTVPTGVGASVLEDVIKITWNRSAEASGYYLDGRNENTGEIDRVATIEDGTADEFTFRNGEAGVSYSFSLRAFNANGISASSMWSNPRKFPGTLQMPEFPANVRAIVQGKEAITLVWEASTNATGYKVYMDVSSSGNFTNCISGPTVWKGTSFTVQGLEPDKNYFFCVTSVNSAGESEKAVTSAKTGPSSGGQLNVDFTSYNSPGSYVFRVRSNVGVRLIGFMGSVKPGNILGGVDAFANEHGFKKNLDLLGTQSRDFPIIFVTEEQFYANINNLSVLETTPFTRLYGFYNAVGSNEEVYEINEGLGGDKNLEVTPSRFYNVELRLNSPSGPTLGFVSALQHASYFNIVDGFYQVFVIIRKFNPWRNEIISYTPTWESGVMAGSAKSVSVGLDAGTPTYRIDIDQLLHGTILTTGSGFILIENRGSSAVQAFKGGVVQLTSTGSNFINPGETKLFQVNMAELQDGKFAQNASLASYRIGSNTINAGSLGDFEVEIDKIYRVIVTGNDGGFSVSVPVYEGDMEI